MTGCDKFIFFKNSLLFSRVQHFIRFKLAQAIDLEIQITKQELNVVIFKVVLLVLGPHIVFKRLFINLVGHR